MRPVDNSSKSKKSLSQDGELSFEEKIKNCSEAIHSGKAGLSKHRYHFLVETEDGEGISLSEDELGSYLKHRNSIQHPIQSAYLVESEDGFCVRVPADKLDSWIEAQHTPPRPLTPSEQLVCDRIVTRLYGQSSAKPSSAHPESSLPPSTEAPAPTEPTKKVSRSTVMLWMLSVALVCVSALALFFAFRSFSLEEALSKAMANLDASISKCQAVSNARDQLRDTAYQYSDEINFWRSNVVITTEFGEKYHTYGCQYIKDSDILWFMNVGVAKVRGYEACSICSPAIY